MCTVARDQGHDSSNLPGATRSGHRVPYGRTSDGRVAGNGLRDRTMCTALLWVAPECACVVVTAGREPPSQCSQSVFSHLGLVRLPLVAIAVQLTELSVCDHFYIRHINPCHELNLI